MEDVCVYLIHLPFLQIQLHIKPFSLPSFQKQEHMCHDVNFYSSCPIFTTFHITVKPPHETLTLYFWISYNQ